MGTPDPPATSTTAPAAAASRTHNHSHRAGPPKTLPLIMNSRAIISLGTIIMSFVAKPLARLQNESGTAPKFAEVQVYFYNFNNKAGMMSRCNIAQFPIFTDYFAREYARVRMENISRAVNFTVAEFIGFLGSKMIDDPMNPAYNIQELYRTANRTSRNGEQSEQNQPQYVASGSRGEAISGDEYNRRLERLMLDPELGNISGSPDFVMPQISFEFEALPSALDNSKTILKLHIFDRASSPNSSLRELLDSSVNNLLASFSAVPYDASQAQQVAETRLTATGNQAIPNDSLESIRSNWQEIHEDITQAAVGRGLLTQDPHDPQGRKYFFTGGPARLKRMVMQYMPHIIYGAMGTTVKSANVSSKQDPLLATINMQRSLNADPITPNGQQVGGVPLSVYPIDLSITTLGCPFVRFSQEFFVDFNTNTTVDNIYYVMGLSHRFESGTYETTIKLTANDAFGKFRSFVDQINNGVSHLQNITQPTTQPQQQTRHRHRRRT